MGELISPAVVWLDLKQITVMHMIVCMKRMAGPPWMKVCCGQNLAVVRLKKSLARGANKGALHRGDRGFSASVNHPTVPTSPKRGRY